MVTKYVNHKGEEFDFAAWDTRLKETDWHKNSWTPNTVEQLIGTKIKGFKKEPLQLELTISFRGGVTARKESLNSFFEMAECDVVFQQPGKLYVGDYYIACYVISGTTTPTAGFTTERKSGIYAAYPFWLNDLTMTFKPLGLPGEVAGLDFPFDFPFDFAGATTGVKTWNINHYAPCNFMMTVYGPVDNPRITINNHVYEVAATLADGEYMQIDSRYKTVYKTMNNGVQVNLFNARGKEQSVFEQLQPGANYVNWSGEFGFDITAFLERGEPKWI